MECREALMLVCTIGTFQSLPIFINVIFSNLQQDAYHSQPLSDNEDIVHTAVKQRVI